MCRICGGDVEPAGEVAGRYSGRTFQLQRCGTCGFVFVANPWLDFERIYDERYYAGEGADPLVDYEFELEHPSRTVRVYEWRGIARHVHGLLPAAGALKWLDYGCGNGGLVRHLREQVGDDAVGFETGAIVESARRYGIPILDDVDAGELAGRFDVVSAVEVLEHTVDPVAELVRMRRLLRDGGLLFVTTGNSEPFRDELTKWRYVTPEIHISYFEPRTLATAFERAGFRPAVAECGKGFSEIMKFKVLKNLRVRRRSIVTDLLPARPIAALADRPTRLSRMPIGWAA